MTDLSSEQGAVTLLTEDFDGDWASVTSSDFTKHNGGVRTNGRNDGAMTFAPVDLSGHSNGKISFDAAITGGSFEEWGTRYGDYLKVEIIDQNGVVHLLDFFTGKGKALTGSQTGQQITPGMDGLSWDLPEGVTSAQLRITSSISASSESIQIDNLAVTAEPAPVAATVDVAAISLDAVDDTIRLGEEQDIMPGGTGAEGGEDPRGFNILDNDDLGDGVLGVDTTLTAVAPVDTDPDDGGDPTQAVGANVGTPFTVISEGGRAGTVTVAADGTISFDGGTSFIGLEDGEVDRFQLEYTISRTVPGSGEARVIDLDADANGNALEAGDLVSFQLGGVSVRAERAGQAGEGNRAMIFDSANPTGGDDDLASSTQGNVLIISEDLDSGDPDDNAGGGTFFFDFDAPSTVDGITFLDTEEPTPVIKLFDENGDQIGEDISGPVTTDGGLGSQAIGVGGVSQMTITLQGSGAIDDIAFTVPNEIVETDTAVVTVEIEGTTDLPDSTVDAVDDFASIFGDVLATPDGEINGITLGNVYDNDIDPDGDDFFAFQVEGQTLDNTADADGFFGWVDADAGGQIRVNLDGTYQFRDPNADFAAGQFAELSRSTSITYSIEDTTGATDTATITVEVLGSGSSD
ncbi:MAG: hypothetical protein AAF415_14450 [Pseudomonadota bacterium]